MNLPTAQIEHMLWCPDTLVGSPHDAHIVDCIPLREAQLLWSIEIGETHCVTGSKHLASVHSHQ